jgi:hypothetical protein
VSIKVHSISEEISAQYDDYEYHLVFQDGGPGWSRQDAEGTLKKLYDATVEFHDRYSGIELADVPDETVLKGLADELLTLTEKMAWIKCWQHGPSDDMVISVETGKGDIIEHGNLDDRFPLGAQFVLKKKIDQ